MNTTHTITVTPDAWGGFTATCSCGRFESTDHDTKVQAMGAGDRHIARTMNG